ncbi:MAG: hypothetical protein IIV90_03630, partial [Oscillospiraceae bacterium]|nr:hypothetical protein [Oscillospiraceae bacterium]
MKQSAVNKLSLIFKMLVLAGCVLFCVQAFRLASGHAATAPVGLVQNTAVSYLDGELFAQVLEEENLPCLTAATGSNPDDAAALLQQGVGFLVVSLDEATLEEVPGLIE